MAGDILRADQRLVKGKQNFIQFKHVVISVHKEIFHDYVKFIAVGEGQSCPADKVFCFITAQMQMPAPLSLMAYNPYYSGFLKTASCPHWPSCISQNLFYLCGRSASGEFRKSLRTDLPATFPNHRHPSKSPGQQPHRNVLPTPVRSGQTHGADRSISAGVTTASPGAIHPILCRAASSFAPAALCIPLSTPEPMTGSGFAVFTIASTCIFTMSFHTISTGIGGLLIFL